MTTDPRLRKRLRLFLSADLVGSTALKQPLGIGTEAVVRAQQWATIIQSFYSDVATSFDEHWDKVREVIRANYWMGAVDANRAFLGPLPVYWKTIGDEVLFYKDIEGDAHLWTTMLVWRLTLQSVRNKLKQKSRFAKTDLDIKSTAWLAGFPLRNKMISGNLPNFKFTEPSDTAEDADKTLPAEDVASYSDVIDFIGPALDIGFRISQWSTSARMYVSLDLAYILAETESERLDIGRLIGKSDLLSREFGELSINYAGGEYLKGVLGGLTYPKFFMWNYAEGSLEEADALISPSDFKKVSPAEVISFAKKLYGARAKYLSPPFVPNVSSRLYQQHHSAEYERAYEELLTGVAKGQFPS